MAGRILMTADTIGGVWIYALGLVRALAEHGWDVVLATMGAPLSDAQWRQARDIANLQIVESRLKLEWMPDAWDDVTRAGEWLLELSRRVRPDLVHLNNYAHGALPWKVPVVMVGHSCVFSWWKAVHGTAPPGEWRRYHDVVRAGLASAHVIVAPTQAMARALQEHYDLLQSPRVIANGHDAGTSLERPKWNFAFCAGRLWDPGKNVSAVLDIANDLAWPVVLAGGDADGGSACAPHRSRNVVSLGPVPHSEVLDWMARASLFVLPAKYEPFGLALLEAASAGCALIAGDIPSLRETWDGAAAFVPPGDRHALRAAVTHLIHNPAELQRLGRLAKSRALGLTTRTMADQYVRIYQEALCGLFSSTTH